MKMTHTHTQKRKKTNKRNKKTYDKHNNILHQDTCIFHAWFYAVAELQIILNALLSNCHPHMSLSWQLQYRVQQS